MQRKCLNICIVLGSPPGPSETFLEAHIRKIGATVKYLADFPIDIDDSFPRQPFDNSSARLKQRVRASYHRYISNPVKLRSLREFFRSKKINAVLAEYGVCGMIAVKACKDLGIPMVVHFHGFDAHNYEVVTRYEKRYRKMFEYSSAVIAVSHSMVESLVSMGAAREKVVYNPYGVEVGKMNCARSANPEQRVIAVGRFVEKKAPYLTILAFKKVLDRLPAARLIMVGDGPLKDICRQIIKALQIEHAVELKGAMGHENVLSLMRESQIFVQHSLVPSSGDSEGMPVAILEAGANGLPVVSTEHAGINDAVVKGQTGFLVKEGNVEGMANYMYILLTDRELAKHMGKCAREHIRQNFSLERSIEKLREIIETHCL